MDYERNPGMGRPGPMTHRKGGDLDRAALPCLDPDLLGRDVQPDAGNSSPGGHEAATARFHPKAVRPAIRTPLPPKPAAHAILPLAIPPALAATAPKPPDAATAARRPYQESTGGAHDGDSRRDRGELRQADRRAVGARNGSSRRLRRSHGGGRGGSSWFASRSPA